MKKIITTYALFFVLLFVNISTTFGQLANDNESDGILFEITGNELEKPSYLFGTIHSVCPVDMISMENLTVYLSKTDQLVLEMNLQNADELERIQKDVILPKGITIKKLLKPVEYAVLDKFFVENTGTSINDMAHVKPVYLSAIIVSTSKFAGCTNATSYEETLMGFANKNKKSIIGLETAEAQIKAISDNDYTRQAKDLYKFVAEADKSIQTLNQLNITYKTQNSDKVFEFVNNEMANYKEFQTRLLDDRNIDWIPKIEKIIKEKTSFIAVGSGHLGGQMGVVKLLRQKGYVLKAIKI